MMAPEKQYGQQTFDLPERPIPRGHAAPVYYDVRLRRRREQVQRAQWQARRLAQARQRRRWMACAALAACLAVMCGIRIYQSASVAENASAISALCDEIHEMTLDAEMYEDRIAEASAAERIEQGGKRLGMVLPQAEQLRMINRG